jgi:predicted dehydrogenase
MKLGIIMNGVTGRTLDHRPGRVPDKLFLPGLWKLRRLRDGGFFGRIIAVRREFGYWVFEGDWQPSQRPSWNYKKEEGGGIILDMFRHWRYVLDHVVAPLRAVSALGVTHIPERIDEGRLDYRAGWQEVPDNEVFENAFKVQWELFLKHVACNAPFPWTLLEGAKGVQLAELGLRSWRERRWLDVPEVR